jgi:hypothetical protein
LEVLEGFEYAFAGKTVQIPERHEIKFFHEAASTCGGTPGVPPASPERPIQHSSARIRLIIVGLAQFTSTSLHLA